MMKKSKLSDSEVKLIVVLIAMVLLACAYFFGYNMCMKNAIAIEKENEQQRAEIMRLQGMVAKRKVIEDETEQLRQAIQDVIAKYPVDVPTEKAIYLIQGIEDKTGVHFTNANLAMSNLVSSVTAEDGSAGPAGYYGNLNLSYKASYEDFKDMVAYVEEFDDRMNMPSVSVVYDEATGGIAGMINVRMYFLTGTGKEYEEIPDLGIQSGVDCIFGGTGLESAQQEDTGGTGEGGMENDGEAENEGE